MAKKKAKKDFVVFEECPLEMCKKKKLEPQIDKKGFVYAYYCNNCHNYYHLEDLLIEEIEPYNPQTKLEDFL